MRYQLRFLLKAEMMGALSTFGGLAHRLSHRPIVLNLVTTDSIDVSLVYGRLVKQHMDGEAIGRSKTALRGGYFPNFQSAGNDAFRTHASLEFPLP